ncbi:MAG: acyl carrier protein [Myxococcota bacterium]
MTKDEIFSHIREIMVDSFELEAEEITPDAELYEALGLDSIDAVDMFVQLREVTGRRPDPAKAREVRTVAELVTFVENELEAARQGLPEPQLDGPPDPATIAASGDANG